MPLGAAIPAIIGGIGSIGGAALSSRGANKAAKAQSDTSLQVAQMQKQAQDEALAFQKQQYGEQQQRMEPWMQSGREGLQQLGQMGQFQAPGAAGMNEDPGYQFRLAEGQKAMERSAAGRGAALGGGAMKAAERYGQGMASQEYGNVYARRAGEYQQQLNRLENQAGVGQTTGQNLGVMGQNAANQMGNILQYGANQQGGAMQNAAAARASGYINSGNTWGNVVSGLGQLGGDLYSIWK